MNEKIQWQYSQSEWEMIMCQDPRHYPPNYITMLPGQKYKHVCPGCGQEMKILSNHGGK